MNEFKSQIKKLLGNNSIEEAINLLYDYHKRTDEKYEDDILMVKSRYERLKQSKIHGTLNREDIELFSNQLVHSIQLLANNISKERVYKKSSHRFWAALLICGVIIIIFGGLLTKEIKQSNKFERNQVKKEEYLRDLEFKVNEMELQKQKLDSIHYNSVASELYSEFIFLHSEHLKAIRNNDYLLSRSILRKINYLPNKYMKTGNTVADSLYTEMILSTSKDILEDKERIQKEVAVLNNLVTAIKEYQKEGLVDKKHLLNQENSIIPIDSILMKKNKIKQF